MNVGSGFFRFRPSSLDLARHRIQFLVLDGHGARETTAFVVAVVDS